MNNKIKVLIIDDEAGFTSTVKLNLEDTGNYEVREVNDPVQVMPTLIGRFRPDIILLDVVMPGLDGGDIAAQIRAHPTLKKIPIIFLTALATRKDATLWRSGPAQERFLPKPVTVQELVEAIDSELRSAR